MSVIKERNISFTGHILRSKLLEEGLLTGCVYGKRPRRRPKTWLSDNIKEVNGKSFIGIYKMAQERVAYRNHFSSIMNYLLNDDD